MRWDLLGTGVLGAVIGFGGSLALMIQVAKRAMVKVQKQTFEECNEKHQGELKEFSELMDAEVGVWKDIINDIMDAAQKGKLGKSSAMQVMTIRRIINDVRTERRERERQDIGEGEVSILPEDDQVEEDDGD